MSIDFEKAFDSVAHSFMLRATELAGFPKKTLDWIRILLKGFRSHVNHVGNLLELIELGRGARQGDPIASILFVIAIEILLIALRKNQKIRPYEFDATWKGEPINCKTKAYADDVNILMTRDEESVREVIRVLSQFQVLSGLKVNRDKTQMLKMGRSHASDSNLCVDLGLKWVNQI